jgi:cell division protein FtsW
MLNYFKNISGDKTLWAVVILLAVFSFLPVYSAASNLAYISREGDTLNFLFKHFVHLSVGFSFMFIVHKVPYKYFSGISVLLLPVVIVLLIYTLLQPSMIDSLSNSSRWIKIPFVGFTFQPSTLAGVVLMIYVSRFLAKFKDMHNDFSKSIFSLWLPVLAVLILILPANFSTTAILFSMIIALCFVGGYPIKNILFILITSIFLFAFFIVTVRAFPELFPNRVDTWKNRVENFISKDDIKKDSYQIEKAKIAIASGGIRGLGPGKSVQKNFLPQSSSDFIFAIIVEEYGLVGGLFLISIYILFLIRIIIISNKSNSIFGTLVVIGLGVPIVFQAFINIGVSVELFPVTGQPLPLISSGGTSIWMTCIAIGIIQSVMNGQEISTEIDDSDNPLEILNQAV